MSRAFCGHFAGCLQSPSVHQFSQQSVHHTWSPEQQGVPRNQMDAFCGEFGHSTEAREGKRGRRQVVSSWLVSQVSATSPAPAPPPCSPTSSNSTSLLQGQPLSRVFHQAHNWQQGGELLHDLASSSQASGDVLLFIFNFILYWSIANYQCCDSFKRTAKGLGHTGIYSPLNSPPIQNAT